MNKINKIIFLNLIIFIISILILEIILRSALSIKHFKNPNVNYWQKTWYRFYQPSYVEFDDKLKYIPKIINLQKIDKPRWKKDSSITINKLKFRSNENNTLLNSKKRILTIGDSFTFGDQVSNNETWPSCLEKKTSITTDNAGLSGYGTAQAVRRGIIESNKRKYDYLIWSVLFGDFDRDINNDLIVKKNNKIKFNNFSKTKEKIIKRNKNLYDYLKEYLFIFYLTDREIVKKINNKFKNKDLDNIKKNKNKISIKPNKLVEFLVLNFKEIDIENKFILLQYGDQSETLPKIEKKILNKTVNKYKEILINIANNNNIIIIDTIELFNKFTDSEKRQLWFDHHTPKGNLFVCNFLIEKIDFN